MGLMMGNVGKNNENSKLQFKSDAYDSKVMSFSCAMQRRKPLEGPRERRHYLNQTTVTIAFIRGQKRCSFPLHTSSVYPVSP